MILVSKFRYLATQQYLESTLNLSFCHFCPFSVCMRLLIQLLTDHTPHWNIEVPLSGFYLGFFEGGVEDEYYLKLM